MAPIPLMKFPGLVQQKLLRHFETTEIIDLSFHSRAFTRHLRHVGLPISSLQFFLNTTTTSIFINKSIEFSVDHSRPISSVHRKISGETLEIERGSPYKYVFIAETPFLRDKLRILELLSTHFLSIFKVRRCELVLNLETDLWNLFFWKLPFHKISLVQNGSEPIVIGSEDLKLLMAFDNVKEMVLNVKVSNAIHPEQIEDVTSSEKEPKPKKHLEIQCTSWVDFGEFWTKMNCKTLKISMRDFFDNTCLARMNGVLNQWRMGFSDHLVDVEMVANMNLVDFKYQIFKDTQASPTVFIEAVARHYPDFDLAKDLTRATDGRIATVILFFNRLIIMVWTDERFDSMANL